MTMPRKGTMAAQLAKPGFAEVLDVEAMPYGNFLRHCRERHPALPFVTRNEHEQDHRLHPSKDHTHTNMQDTEAADGLAEIPAPKPARRPRTAGK